MAKINTQEPKARPRNENNVGPNDEINEINGSNDDKTKPKSSIK